MPASLEVGLAILCVIGAARSMWIWARRPFESQDAVDHLLYAAFVTGRVGLWLSVAGWFALYANVDASGGSLARYRWYLVVPLVLAAVQFLASFFIGRRGERQSAAADGDGASRDGETPPNA